MQYLGGKFRLRKQISGVINEIFRREVQTEKTDFANYKLNNRQTDRQTDSIC